MANMDDDTENAEDTGALSLFDAPPDEQYSIDLTNAKLDIVQADFLGAQTVSWEELFDGYNSLCAITYSSGIDFVCRLLKKFERAEIIFGFQGVMSYTLQEIMAYQFKTIERLRERASKSKTGLLARVDDGSLRLSVARKQLSHEKIYLLRANDGRKRVINGRRQGVRLVL